MKMKIMRIFSSSLCQFFDRSWIFFTSATMEIMFANLKKSLLFTFWPSYFVDMYWIDGVYIFFSNGLDKQLSWNKGLGRIWSCLLGGGQWGISEGCSELGFPHWAVSVHQKNPSLAWLSRYTED